MYVLSFVFWKSKYYENERMEWFVENVKMLNPDVILLHNVTNDIINILLKSFETYTHIVSDVSKEYYEMILTKYKIKNHKYSKFSNTLPPNQGPTEGLFTSIIEAPVGEILLGVSTFSTSNKKYDQLECAYKFLENQKKKYIFSSQTNIYSSKNDKETERQDIDWMLKMVTCKDKNPIIEPELVSSRPNRIYSNLKTVKHMLFGNCYFIKHDKKLSCSNIYGLLVDF